MLISTDKYKVVSTTLLFVFFFQGILAQSFVSGKIVDPNNKPIPFAHIRLENTNIGTISNDIGVFKLVVNVKDNNKSLFISSLGYNTKKIPLNDQYQTIILTEDVTQLNEVIIIAKDHAKELVKKAIKAIPNNYSKTKERHTGFFRETTTRKNKEKPIYIVEAVVETIKKDYTKRNKSGDVKLVESRKYESDELDSIGYRIYAGSHHTHRFDIVARREAFLSNPEGYKYKIIDTLKQKGKDIYKVFIKKKNKNSAYIYIQEETFAIIKADMTLATNVKVLGPNRQFLNFTVVYEQGKDKLWRFSNSYYTTAFKRKGKLLYLTSEYVTTNITPNETKIPYPERLQYSEITLNETKEYDPNFWNNYTIISPNKMSESLFESVDYSTKIKTETKIKTKIKKQSNNLLTFLKNISSEIGLTWTAFDIASNNINYTNTVFDIQQNNEATNRGGIGFTTSLFYTIKPHFLIGYANESKISKTGITANDIVISSNFNLNPNGRPIRILPQLHFGYQKLDYFIEQFPLEEDIEIDGKRINSDKVDTFLSQKGFRLKPTLVLSIEKNKRISFLISAAYNLPLDNKNGLAFHERGTFLIFPRKIFLENGQERLSIETNQKNVFQNTLSINASISFKF